MRRRKRPWLRPLIVVFILWLLAAGIRLLLRESMEHVTKRVDSLDVERVAERRQRMYADSVTDEAVKRIQAMLPAIGAAGAAGRAGR